MIVSRGMSAARVLEKTGATGSTETQHSIGNATLFRLLFSLQYISSSLIVDADEVVGLFTTR